jgi:hypothetical protein
MNGHDTTTGAGQELLGLANALGRYSQLTVSLNNAFTGARALALDLAHDIHAGARAQAGALALDIDRAREEVGALDSDLVRAYVTWRTRDVALARNLSGARDLVRALDGNLARARARVRAFDVDVAVTSHLAHDLARDLECDLDSTLTRGRKLAYTLARLDLIRTHRLRDDDAAGRTPSHATDVAPSAGRLVAVAARLLPASDRDRYSEEYSTELWEIASTGAGRRQQIQHAARVLTRTIQVRGEVLAPRRKNASP